MHGDMLPTFHEEISFNQTQGGTASCSVSHILFSRKCLRRWYQCGNPHAAVRKGANLNLSNIKCIDPNFLWNNRPDVRSLAVQENRNDFKTNACSVQKYRRRQESEGNSNLPGLLSEILSDGVLEARLAFKSNFRYFRIIWQSICRSLTFDHVLLFSRRTITLHLSRDLWL